MKRDTHISKIKGIGICLMVFGHALWLGSLHDIIYLFHMPLFFITTGYLFKERWLLTPPLCYMRNQFKKQYLVYVKWCLFFLLLHNVFMHIGIMNEFYGYKGIGYEYYSLIQMVKKAVRNVVFMDDGETLLAGFWFIRTLFVSSVLVCTLRYLVNKVLDRWQCSYFYLNLLISITTLLIILYLFYCYDVKTIYVETKEVLAMIFLLIGMLLYRVSHYPKMLVIAIAGIFILIYWQCGAVNMFAPSLGKAIEVLLTGTIGWIVIFHISEKMGKIGDVFAYCGDKSLLILTWHLLCFKLPTMLYLFFTNDDMNKVSSFPSLQIESLPYVGLCALAGIALPLLLGKLYNSFISVIKEYSYGKQNNSTCR